MVDKQSLKDADDYNVQVDLDCADISLVSNVHPVFLIMKNHQLNDRFYNARHLNCELHSY